MNNAPTLFARQALAGAIALALAGAVAAQTVNGIDGNGTPGGNASVSFDFDFGTVPLSVSALTFSLAWDASRLTFTGGSAWYNGSPVDALAALAATGDLQVIDNSSIGNIGALWAAVDPISGDSLPPLELAGTGKLSFDFLLAPGFPVPGSSPVALGIVLARGDTPITLDAIASVNTVPEPQTWALLLAGGAGVAAWVRRRSRG